MNKPENSPVIIANLCINCDECISICPTHAIYKKTVASCAKCIKYCISMKVPCNPDQ